MSEDVRTFEMVVMVDHKSKFAYEAAMRNTCSKNISRVESQNLLPMCVHKPERMLSDNEPEFVGNVFESMLQKWEIKNVQITPNIL